MEVRDDQCVTGVDGLRDAVVIVTGASDGIGLETARQLAAAGAIPVLVARRGELLMAEVQSLAAQGEMAYAVESDLGHVDAPAHVVDAVVTRFGRVDGLVNNAAIVRHLPLTQWTSDLFDAHIAVNLRAPFFLVQQAAPHLATSAWGSVVNVSSSSGALHLKGQSVYGMTKAGVDYLTRTLAGELADTGVRVNGVAPGPIDTAIHLSWADDIDAAYRWLAEQVPLGRIGSTREVAAMILFLLGPDSSFITGAVVPVDGGQVVRP